MAASDRAPVRVLVAEDYPDTRRTLCLLLRMWGYDVRDAENGQEALRVAGEFFPEVVILDLAMPGVDGYEVARRLRAPSQGLRPLLIALTAHTDRTHVGAALEAGFDHFLAKPCSPGQVDFLLRSFLRAEWQDAASV